MGGRLLRVAVTVLVLVNLALLYALLHRGDGPASQPTTSADSSSATGRPTPSVHPSATSSAHPSLRAHPSTTRSAHPSARAHRTARRSAQAIVLTRKRYVARRFHAVRLVGTWRAAADGRHAVRVELRRGTGWSAFPLPAVIGGSGRFTAYVDLGAPGTYRLRVVASTGRLASAPFPVTVR